ncbi:hypothetical protein SAMN05421644_14521, partial [Allochromatium warmingii]
EHGEIRVAGRYIRYFNWLSSKGYSYAYLRVTRAPIEFATRPDYPSGLTFS